MNEDNKILEEMVGEIIEEASKHGKKFAVEDLLADAATQGLIRYEKKNGKWFIYSLKDRTLYTAHLGESGLPKIISYLRKIGYDK